MLYQPKSGTQKLKCQLTVNSATFLLDTSPLINFIDVLYNIHVKSPHVAKVQVKVKNPFMIH